MYVAVIMAGSKRSPSWVTSIQETEVLFDEH